MSKAQIPASYRTGIERRNDSVYLPSLKQVVDVLFEHAYRKHWTWAQLARQSGLSYSTVKSLGMYKTKYPQLRTVQLIAHALGGQIAYERGQKKWKLGKTLTPKVFAA